MSEAILGQDTLDGAHRGQGAYGMLMKLIADGFCTTGQAAVVEIKSVHHNDLFDFLAGIENLLHRGVGSSYLRAGERQMACRPCR